MQSYCKESAKQKKNAENRLLHLSLCCNFACVSQVVVPTDFQKSKMP